MEWTDIRLTVSKADAEAEVMLGVSAPPFLWSWQYLRPK